ncbi:MAG TPA: FAD-dependent oxidoreductase, partial [Puia sp.]|nr:FAD-dependent oxidoreductase [Puia sp.]
GGREAAGRAAGGWGVLHPDRMPVYIWEYGGGKMFYGFPDLGRGIKIGFHHQGREIAPEDLRQEVDEQEVVAIREIARSYLSIEPVYGGASVCMYTNTPDEDFIIDEYPGWPQVLVLSPCSGHGFKFSSVVGKIAGDWANGGLAAAGSGAGSAGVGTGVGGGFDLRPFRLGRFG